jgi:hypothetical protein
LSLRDVYLWLDTSLFASILVYMASSRFVHVTVPGRLLPLLGDRDRGTRIYRRFGSREDFGQWFDAVWQVCAPEGALPPGAVGQYATVSRAGVHKRMKEGRLTAFLYHLLDGDEAERPANDLKGAKPYTFIPVQECRAWAEALNGARSAGQDGPAPAASARVAPADDDSWRQW